MLRRKQDSKLGAVAPRHAAWLCRAAHLGKGSASPSRCIPSEQGAFRGPRAPQRPRGLAPWNPRQAFAPDTTTKNPARFFDLCPTVRRLNARSGTFAFPTPNDQRRSALDRKSEEPCSSDTTSVRLSRPTPRRKAFRLSTPDQARAAWMGASVRRWTRLGGAMWR